MGLPEQIVTDEALDAISHYSFPGNVRELENILERAITFCEENTITSNDLHLTYAEEIEQSGDDSNNVEQIRLDNYLAEIEKKIIVDALTKNRFNKTVAAKQLGVSFCSFHYRIQRLGID